MRPLVSVIIPTHNRPDCAVSTIRAVLAAGDCLEVIVSDTSEKDNISPAFSQETLPRLKLLRPGHALSVVDNFNLAMAAASGEYLVFIGDDDLVAPQIAEVACWAKDQGVDAIGFTFPALYYWPNFASTTRWKAAGSTLVVNGFSGKAAPFDAKEKLAEALQNMGAGVLDMPRAYAGMVSRQLVQRIVAKHGALFGGVSPDIYSAALISLECSKAYRIDYPIVIPGASGGSTSGHSARGKHVGGLRDNAHIGAFKNLVWDERVPEYYSVPTVWGYSLLKAIEDKPQWLARTDFSRLYIKCLISDPQYKALVLGCLRGHARTQGYAVVAVEMARALWRETKRVAGILARRMRPQKAPSPARAGVVIEGLSDTQQALTALLGQLSVVQVRLQLGEDTQK